MMKYCSAPWDTVHINHLGRLSSCFCGFYHRKGDMGSVVYHSINELYNSPTQQEFRASILDQTFRYCREDTCVEYYRMVELDQPSNIPNTVVLPTTIQLQIDPVCNLKCSICRTKNIYYTEAKPTAARILERLIEEYQTFEKPVNLHCDGSGEVFVSRAYLDFFEREDIPKCFNFTIQTNGNLLTKNKKIIEKLRPNIEMFEISLDAANEVTYKELRGGNFHIVLEGIKLLKQMNITVWTQFIVQQSNYKQIPEYVKLCKDLGVDKICLQSLVRLVHMTDQWWSQNSFEHCDPDTINSLTAILQEIKKDPQIELSGGLEHLLSVPVSFVKY